MDENKSSQGHCSAPCNSLEHGDMDMPQESGEKTVPALGVSASSISSFGKAFPFKRRVRLKTLPGPLSENTLRGVAEYILTGKCHHIIVLSGAGISTQAGIPDFRSSGSGLYYSAMDKVSGLRCAENLFDINVFRCNPKPLYTIGRFLFDTILRAKPTFSHFFIQLLAQKGLLLRNYTQNIDGLEKAAGIDPSLIIEAHGSLSTASCIECRKCVDIHHFHEALKQDKICVCPACGSYVKPDIVLFGEQLPERFFDNIEIDCMKCDLVLVMGTSLAVHPISLLTQFVSPSIPLVLINNERVGMFRRHEEETSSSVLFSDCSSHSDSRKDSECTALNEEAFLERNSGWDEATEIDSDNMNLAIYERDVVWLGTCDDGCKELTNLLHWNQDMDALMRLHSPLP